MPGKVLDVLVEKSQSVTKGEGLQSRSYENGKPVKAEQDGIIKSLNVSVGDAVEKNIILIEFE